MFRLYQKCGKIRQENLSILIVQYEYFKRCDLRPVLTAQTRRFGARKRRTNIGRDHAGRLSGAQEYGEDQQTRKREGTHTHNGGAELPRHKIANNYKMFEKINIFNPC